MKMAEILGDGYNKKIVLDKNFNMKKTIFFEYFWVKSKIKSK